LLKAYFDESGAHGGQNDVFALGGFVAPEERWERIEEVWNDQLGRRVFRMSHWENRKGEFDGWPSEKRRLPLIAALTDSVRNNIQNTHSLGTSHAVVFNVFCEALCPEASPHQAKRLAYGCLLMACLSDILRVVPIPKDGIQVICEEFEGITGFATECFRKFQTDRGLHGKWHGIIFEKKATFRGLQVADLLAYEGFKYITHRISEEERRPIRKSFDALVKSRRLYVAYAGDKSKLEALRREYDSLPQWPDVK
jgi:hypothetical protein